MTRLTEPVLCMTCGTPTDHVCRVCGPCIDSQAIASRRAQGLSDRIERPTTIARLATFYKLAVERAATKAAS